MAKSLKPFSMLGLAVDALLSLAANNAVLSLAIVNVVVLGFVTNGAVLCFAWPAEQLMLQEGLGGKRRQRKWDRAEQSVKTRHSVPTMLEEGVKPGDGPSDELMQKTVEMSKC
eukprot:1155141-Pelagomonas_calceolata.AAC.3